MQMLSVLMNQGRAKYEELAGHLQKWKILRGRCSNKKDSDGTKHDLPDDIARASLLKLVPTEVESHLLLNHGRLTNFDLMETEIILLAEQKTGDKLMSGVKDTGGSQPMEIGSLKDLAALISAAKGGGKGAGEGKCFTCGKPGHMAKDCRSGGGGKGKGSGGAPASGKGNCHNCGKPGHYAAECRGPGGKAEGKGKGAGAKGASQRVCYNCDKPDHLAKDCFSKVRKGKGSKKGMASLEDGTVEEEELGAIELCGLTAPQIDVEPLAACEKWIKCNFDTGAAKTALPENSVATPGKETGRFYRAAS